MKRIIKALAISLVLCILVGCGSKRNNISPSTPAGAAIIFLNEAKAYTQKAISEEAENQGLSLRETVIIKKIYSFINDASLQVVDQEIYDDDAIVSVKISNYDIASIFYSISDYEDELPENVEGLSEKELLKIVDNILSKIIADVKSKGKTQEETIEIPVHKEGNEWVCDIPLDVNDSDFADVMSAMFGGLY